MDVQSQINLIKGKFPNEVLENFATGTFVNAEKLKAICQFCRDNEELSMQVLTCMTAVDLGDHLELVYHLISYSKKHDLVLKVTLPRDNAVIDSVESVWKTADWQERECFDLFGVNFKNHPDLRRIMLPDDWQGHPLRKDYTPPTEYHGMSHTRKNPLIPEGQSATTENSNG
ncbi:MAG: hypothetical protein A2504_07945 [Bdellovibrionales bacterium RIFOXYD12_FULL_39_22]|nr:MAG: hypothetical protein A2385_13570 [Bdellovibrionales bacterium RIFOXYB1_FULL_39_21]OFZ44862.1 MAG: hypothetical protein A2485_14780 [Bdellovibrionales bacterium RIFOXYC12_FULL_39_17]OFZ49380.1 MAG: hypothetical protein A2404_09115 [Bdellovibrionales bacterium RIFOXYC1_FULL_39_130]OFZ73899.1 MAG: hypothetical protein A2451_07710 [Bdellovibrionales bacterium RIFOXYC2_FULL_39_8]OFZ77101.1 MAG: hypothetical protein A2560_10765 [Bdellovibrionales bacterium RIFOXYD1_FULL_39_84]OFZ95562.1 MAG: